MERGEDESVERALKTGNVYPSFNSIEEGVAAAKARSAAGGANAPVIHEERLSSLEQIEQIANQTIYDGAQTAQSANDLLFSPESVAKFEQEKFKKIEDVMQTMSAEEMKKLSPALLNKWDVLKHPAFKIIKALDDAKSRGEALSDDDLFTLAQEFTGLGPAARMTSWLVNLARTMWKEGKITDDPPVSPLYRSREKDNMIHAEKALGGTAEGFWQTIRGWFTGGETKTKDEKPPSLNLAKAPLLWSFPTRGEAQDALEAGFGYGSGHEGFMDGTSPLWFFKGGLKERTIAGLVKQMDDPKGHVQSHDMEHALMITQAGLAVQRNAVAKLGFDPRRVVVTAPKAEDNLTIRGAYSSDQDRIWSQSGAGNNIVHESIHRGLTILQKRRPDIFEKYFPSGFSSTQNELLTRYMMIKYAGNTRDRMAEEGVQALDLYEGKDGISKMARSFLEEIMSAAEEEVGKRRGPR